jgi:hypothetical protein
MQTPSKPVNYKFKKIFEFSLHQRLDDLRLRNLLRPKIGAFNQEVFFVQKTRYLQPRSPLCPKKLDAFNKKPSSHQLTHPTHSFINSTDFTLWNFSPKNILRFNSLVITKCIDHHENAFATKNRNQPHTAQPNRLNSAAQTKSKKYTSTNPSNKTNEIFTSHTRTTRTVVRNGEFEGQSPSSQDDSYRG